MARFVRAVHGREPLVLREDFSGPAGLCGEWVKLSQRHRAVAVDIDREPLAHAVKHPRITLRCADATRFKDRADSVVLCNFAVCELHERAQVVAYLKSVRASLKTRGVVVLDLYGGVNAYAPGKAKTFARMPDGSRVEYVWEQRGGDPISGMVNNAIHFRVGKRVMRDAFTYHWRLWTIADIIEAMRAAGFRGMEVYDRMGSALDGEGRLHVEPVRDGRALDEDYVVYVVGRK